MEQIWDGGRVVLISQIFVVPKIGVVLEVKKEKCIWKKKIDPKEEKTERMFVGKKKKETYFGTRKS